MSSQNHRIRRGRVVEHANQRGLSAPATTTAHGKYAAAMAPLFVVSSTWREGTREEVAGDRSAGKGMGSLEWRGTVTVLRVCLSKAQPLSVTGYYYDRVQSKTSEYEPPISPT